MLAHRYLVFQLPLHRLITLFASAIVFQFCFLVVVSFLRDEVVAQIVSERYLATAITFWIFLTLMILASIKTINQMRLFYWSILILIIVSSVISVIGNLIGLTHLLL